MIDSLDDAWRWYESSRQLARTMERLGEKHWDALPWDGGLGLDEHLKHQTAANVLENSRTILEELDDLCVLLLFSVFEAKFRERISTEVQAEQPSLRHTVIKRAVRELIDGIEQGGFHRVLEPYKDINADLTEQINQVRKYRNWVAHGRRSERPDAVNPRIAYERLKSFLALVVE